jgi:hypothetical protein
MQDSEELSLATQDLGEQIRLWRRDHKPPSRFPAEYWQRAMEIASRHGVFKTARALRVDYMSLKRRMGLPVQSRPRSQAHMATFLEWLPPLPGVIGECTLDVTSQSGLRLGVKLKDIAPSTLGSILRDFAGQPQS